MTGWPVVDDTAGHPAVVRSVVCQDRPMCSLEPGTTNRPVEPSAKSRAVTLHGVRFTPWTHIAVIEHITTRLRSPAGPRGGWVVTPNTDIMRTISRRPEIRDLVSRASVVTADGMPLVWASRLQGSPLPERVTGASLLPGLAAAAARHGLSVYLLGGAEGVAPAAAEALRRRHPSLRVVGAWSPPYGLQSTPEGMGEVARRVSEAAPDLVFAGFGFPAQEQVIAAVRPRLPDTWFVGCGIALAYVGGVRPRAPEWMQGHGLEWVHRLLTEPRRLARRYLINDLPFALRLLAGASWQRLMTRAR